MNPLGGYEISLFVCLIFFLGNIWSPHMVRKQKGLVDKTYANMYPCTVYMICLRKHYDILLQYIQNVLSINFSVPSGSPPGSTLMAQLRWRAGRPKLSCRMELNPPKKNMQPSFKTLAKRKWVEQDLLQWDLFNLDSSTGTILRKKGPSIHLHVQTCIDSTLKCEVYGNCKSPGFHTLFTI